MPLRTIQFSVLIALFCVFWGGLARADKEYEVSLFTGISGLVKLGDSYATVVKNIVSPRTDIPLDTDPELTKLGFAQGVAFKKMGMKLFFSRTGVVLITMQEPFAGFVKSKKIKLFSFMTPPVDDWESFLIRELGNPELRASSGRLSSQALFYPWGDISFNRMGPNELALYRDAKIAKYRQTKFGREVILFKIDE